MPIIGSFGAGSATGFGQRRGGAAPQTFDYMFLVDTENMTLGYTDWDTVEKRMYFTEKSPSAKVKFEQGDYTILASNILPSKKSITATDILNGLELIL